MEKQEITRLKNVCTIKNVDMEMAIEELTRISKLTSNSVQGYIENIIHNLQRSINQK